MVPAAGPVPVAVAVPGYGDFALPPSAPAEAPRPVLQARGRDGGGGGGGGGHEAMEDGRDGQLKRVWKMREEGSEGGGGGQRKGGREGGREGVSERERERQKNRR